MHGAMPGLVFEDQANYVIMRCGLHSGAFAQLINLRHFRPLAVRCTSSAQVLMDQKLI